MVDIQHFIASFNEHFEQCSQMQPWHVVDQLEQFILEKQKSLGDEYIIENNIAIHRSAVIEQGVILKGCMILSEKVFIGAHAYLRGPIYLGKSVIIGPSTEIKQSMIFDDTTIAHFNYVGSSILGSNINFEAGAICANHYNEREDKTIFVLHQQEIINTHLTKFGALIGDECKIGANAVLSPGSIIQSRSIVKRLELVEQVK